MAKFRAFISVDISRPERFAPLKHDLDVTKAQLKTVELDLIHITLKFLGEVEEADVPRLREVIEVACAGEAAFTFRLKGAGAFPSVKNPRVVWVGIDGGEPMARIAARLEEETAKLGFEKEARPFSPHLTVGRMKGPGGAGAVHAVLEKYRDTEFGEETVNAVRLKKSVLSPRGPAYSTVEEVRLSAQ
jgi:2'-5' RNA ligase